MIDTYATRRALAPSSTTPSSTANNQKPSSPTVQKGEVNNISSKGEDEGSEAINRRLRVKFGLKTTQDFSNNLAPTAVKKFSLNHQDNASNIKTPESPYKIKSALKGSTNTIEFDPKNSPSTTTISSRVNSLSEEENNEEDESLFREVEDDDSLVANERKKTDFSQHHLDPAKEVSITEARDFAGKEKITPEALKEIPEFKITDRLARIGAYSSEQEIWASEKLATAKEDLEKAELGLAWAQKNTKFDINIFSQWHHLAQERYENAAAFAFALSRGTGLTRYSPATSPKEEAPGWSKPVDLVMANVKQIVDSCAQAAKAEEQANSIKQQLKELRQVGHNDESKEILLLEKNYREAYEQRRASAYQAQSLYKATIPTKE